MRPKGRRFAVLSYGWSLLLVVIAMCAIAPASALAKRRISKAGDAGPVIAQSVKSECLATPSDTIHLTGPVVAGDDLVLLVSGQGFDAAAPVVTGVSDPVNGNWTQLVNDKSTTLDGMRYLGYAVYQVKDSKAAPGGLKVTVNQQPGQSAAGAVLLDLATPATARDVQFVKVLGKSGQNLTSPSVSATAGQLAVGLFGAYNTQQTFSAGSAWTVAATASNCTRALAESQVVPSSGNVAASVAVSKSTYYYGGLLVFSDGGATAATSPITLPPLNTSPPTISGTPVQGDTLTASPGSWADSPTSYSYQWQDCDSLLCSNISGATGSAYTLQSSDVGKTIDVVVTASNSAGSTPGVSGQTGTVQRPPAPVNTAPPMISGSTVQGDTLSASAGSWSNNPSSYGYQWQDCSSSTSCSSISGATSSTYTLQSSDVGKTLDVVVTATNAGGSTSATSAQTSSVQPPAPVNTSPPSISGTAKQGDTLTASNGSWSGSPTSYLYQWQDCTSSSSCSNISGATSSSYTLQSSDVGKTIDVVVTATNSGGSASATSAQTGSVQAATSPAPVNTAAPAISGTAQQGDTLTATNGTWSNSPTSYAYQWQDCTSSSSCANISGATSSSYTLQSSDVGKTIDVVVTATNSGGSASATSAQTGSVKALAPVNTAAPAITGTAQQGDSLTATTGSWSNNPTSYTYQWQDCTSSSSCSNISGATGSTYTLQSSDVGDTIDVVVTASNSGGSASKASAQTATVTSSGGSGGGAGSPAVTAVPTVTGNTIVGDALTATSGSWSNSPTSYAYQWQDCIGTSCSNIAGATSSSYTIQSSDVGHSLAVVVTATNSSGSNHASSYNTAAAGPSSVGNSLVDAAYLLGFSPPSGCSTINATCITSTDPPNWNAINEVLVFALLGESPAKDATTTGSVSGTITSIPASVTTTIPAGPIMLTTDSSSPSSGSYQILQTSGASSGATSIPVTGSPTANATYASGSVVMVQGLNSSQNSVPTGSTLSGLVSAIHSENATALISLGGSNDENWGSDCANGYQYLLGATLATDYIQGYDMDGVEIDDEDLPPSSACWNGLAEAVHAVATAAGKVPIVYSDFNPTDTSYSVAEATETQIDQFTFEYYGYDPSNDYNCSDDCSKLASFLNTGNSDGIPSQKWIALQGLVGGGYSQTQTTTLGTTTASTSGSVSSIPVSALSAAVPAGTFVLAAPGSPSTQYEILETSGAAEGATSIPVTGHCSAAGWTMGSGNCSNASSVSLNGTYASGDDVYMDSTGYSANDGAYFGGWDCGNNAAYAAAHNMGGVGEWYWNGSANSALCFDQIQPFVSGGLG
jgi:hypothetical protein